MNSENYKQFVKANKLVIVPILVGISSIIIIVFIIIPQVLSYFNIKTEINQGQSKLTILEAKAKELNNLDQSETDNGLKVVSTVLPSDADIAGVIAELQDLASKSNLELSHVGYINSQSATEKKNNFQIEVKLIGPLVNLRTFLLSLQNYPRIIQVENIVVQQTSKSVESTVPLTVYYASEKPSIVSSVDKPIVPLSEDQKKILSQLDLSIKNKNIATPGKSVVAVPNIGDSNASSSATTTPNLNLDTSSVPLGKVDPFN